MENKKKPTTSTAVKRRYNEKNYKQINTQVRFDLADRIAKYREQEKISMPQFLERAIDILEKLR